MQIAKWGNSLAVRIPAAMVRELGLQEGDDVDLRLVGEKELALITERERREAAVAILRTFRGSAPPDFVFDREEANAR